MSEILDGYRCYTPDLKPGNANNLPRRVYRAVLQQSGTDAPVATILENTLGVVPVIIRSIAGQYIFGKDQGVFSVLNTLVFGSFNYYASQPTAMAAWADAGPGYTYVDSQGHGLVGTTPAVVLEFFDDDLSTRIDLLGTANIEILTYI